MNSSYLKLKENLSYLKLNQMIVHLDETIDLMNRNELSFVDTLIRLTDYVIDMKEINMIKSMVRVAAFPHFKEVKDFDFEFQPSVNKEQILDFTTLRFIDRKENIVFLGPLIDMRYEEKSTIFTTNANFKSWGDFFQDPKLANAILDRILHHATVVNIVGDSYRLKNHFSTEEAKNVHSYLDIYIQSEFKHNRQAFCGNVSTFPFPIPKSI